MKKVEDITAKVNKNLGSSLQLNYGVVNKNGGVNKITLTKKFELSRF